MISREFIKELSKLCNISDKVVLKYPITTLNSDAIDILVNIKADKLGCSEFEDTGIYELNKFVHMFNLFQNPEIIRNTNSIEFVTPGTKSVFTLSDLNVMEHYNQKSSLIESTLKYPDVASVLLTADVIKQFKQASSIFNELNVLAIEGRDNNTLIYLDSHNRFNSSNNIYEKEYLNSSTKNFKLIISVENFNKLPVADYNLRIKYNEDKDAYRILFETENTQILISRLTN